MVVEGSQPCKQQKDDPEQQQCERLPTAVAPDGSPSRERPRHKYNILFTSSILMLTLLYTRNRFKVCQRDRPLVSDVSLASHACLLDFYLICTWHDIFLPVKKCSEVRAFSK